MGHNEIVLVFLPIDPLMVNLGCSDNTVHMNSLVNNLCPVHELSGGLPPQVPVRSISTYFMSEEGLEPEVTQGGNKCSWESLPSPFLYFSLCLSRPNCCLNFHSRDNNNYFILLLIGHSCIPRSTPTSQLVHRLCWGKQSRVASTEVRPFDIFEFEDTGSSLLGNKKQYARIYEALQHWIMADLAPSSLTYHQAWGSLCTRWGWSE